MTVTERKVLHNNKMHVGIINIVIMLFYMACSAYIIIVGIKCSAYDPKTNEGDLLNIIWDSLEGAIAWAATFGGVISFILLKKFRKMSWGESALISITGFATFCFYIVSVNYQFHAVIVALVGVVTFLISVAIALFSRKTVAARPQSIIRTGLGDRIKNERIAGLQVFDCTMTETDEKVCYKLRAVDHMSNDKDDVNGVLCTSYTLRKSDVQNIEFVTLVSYPNLVESDNEITRAQLISFIEEKRDEIRSRLQQISTPDKVSKEDCCLARIMVLYEAYLKMLKGETESLPDAYVGEYGFGDGELGVPLDVEKSLFTLVRTGLLGGILAGPKCIYNFRYRKNGYKNGRQYCAFHIEGGQESDKNHIYLCMVVIKEGTMKALPPHIIQAVRKMIPRLEEAMRKINRGEENK